MPYTNRRRFTRLPFNVLEWERTLLAIEKELEEHVAMPPKWDLESHFACEDYIRSRLASVQAGLGAAKERSQFTMVHWDDSKEQCLLLEIRGEVAHVRFADGEQQTMDLEHFWGNTY